MHICFATHIVWGFVSKCGSSVYYTLSRHRVRRLLWHVPSVSTYLEGVIQQFTKKMWMARIEIVWCHCVCVCVYFANGNVRRWWFRCYVWKLVDDGTQWYGTIQHDGVHAIWKCCVHNTFGYFRNRFCTVDETINTRTMNICLADLPSPGTATFTCIDCILPPFNQVIFSIEIAIIWDWVPFRLTMHKVHCSQCSVFNRFGAFGCDNLRSNCSRSCYKSCEYLPNLEQTITQNNPKNK